MSSVGTADEDPALTLDRGLSRGGGGRRGTYGDDLRTGLPTLSPVAEAYPPSKRPSAPWIAALLILIVLVRNVLFTDYRSQEVGYLRKAGLTDEEIERFVPKNRRERVEDERKKVVDEAKRGRNEENMMRDIDALRRDVEELRGMVALIQGEDISGREKIETDKGRSPGEVTSFALGANTIKDEGVEMGGGNVKVEGGDNADHSFPADQGTGIIVAKTMEIDIRKKRKGIIGDAASREEAGKAVRY